MELTSICRRGSGTGPVDATWARERAGDREVNVMEPKFYTELNALLADTDLDVIKAYLRWHLFMRHSPGPACRRALTMRISISTRRSLNGQQEQQARWKRCTQREWISEMGEALGQVYVAKYFPPDAKQRAQDMTVAHRGGDGQGPGQPGLDEP